MYAIDSADLTRTEQYKIYFSFNFVERKTADTR